MRSVGWDAFVATVIFVVVVIIVVVVTVTIVIIAISNFNITSCIRVLADFPVVVWIVAITVRIRRNAGAVVDAHLVVDIGGRR